jgi:hypothetical protein
MAIITELGTVQEYHKVIHTSKVTNKFKFYVICIRPLNVKYSLEEAHNICTVFWNYASGNSVLVRKLKVLIPIHRLATESHEEYLQSDIFRHKIK